ncbi:MAG: AAA-like domain-containing protein, partial [Tannerellaceae bacterium]|nr:AAA-like domain-containing protein [Tannerellaceae bacterium]
YSFIPFTYKESYDQDKKNRPLVLLTLFLRDLVKTLDKPLVLLLDEADCLSEGTMISFLRQLRDGYNNRGVAPFVHSVALVGMRNIRDFKVKIRPDSQSLGSASPFNIGTQALTIKNFTREEIAMLYAQHTADTGQRFEPDAIQRVWEQTQGQPWLVNAIAREVVMGMLHSDYTQPITADMVEQAIQTIILRRDTHIDSLLERLKEERVRNVIQPLIIGEKGNVDKLSDDYSYVRDLGLIRDTRSGYEPSNPIYAEVIVRTLNFNEQDTLLNPRYPYQMPRYLKDGRIDMDFLMRDFQQFWRENSAIWKERFLYKESAPHLILMAFLQRIVNGGGQIHREMAAERGSSDLCLVYEGEKYPIELKIWRGEKTLTQGLEQTARYMDAYGCAEGWLAIFDQRPEMKWDDKLYMQKETVGTKTVTVVGL